ncbi:hypothetical protein ANCCEY_02491 [Ancylostoma ceylanicum]|uniref:Uncharacterized protein n=1 Tax=Ancylostoma ceylanicum TaxID=53326 RepID=A0A0D6M2H0_9BILA|nr:hypothetical protein ANCCEY_02491 [Ancylostoma ceylanicum]
MSLKDEIGIRKKREPAAYKKWIVVTSSHSVENIKSLTREGEWQVVVIENTNSVEDRKLEGIHFLGVEEQQLLGYKISEAVLNNSQASRNIGYLYAIERGAEWIFDADDDIELTSFHKPRFSTPTNFSASNISGHENHTNDPDRFCLCHELRTPIVQHSLLRKDAIFSRISVEKSPKNDGRWERKQLRRADQQVRATCNSRYREGERTGELVRFLDAWECPHRKIINCTMLLATELSCEFPLRNDFSKHILATAYEHGCGANCRRASLELEPEMDHKIDRSDLKLRAFSELARWCAKSGFSDLLQNLPNSSQLSTFHANNDVLADLTETVLVVTSNYPWNKTIGLLQRLYQPYFGVTIFCGPWFPEDYDDRNGSFPRMLRPFNYIHIEVDEMRSGWFAYYCLAKVKELRLRNVKGSEAAKKTVRLFEEVYKEDPKVQVTWKKFTKGFRSQNNTNSTASELLMRADGWTASDFYYIPSAGLDYYSELMEIFFQAGLFHEIAMSKYLYSVPHRT